MEKLSSMQSEAADQAGLERFRRAMQDRLAEKRAEGHAGWNTGVSLVDLDRRLCTAFAEGNNEVDVANFLMFIWNLKQERQRP